MIQHVTKPLEEFKPRKAKYGFKGRVSPDTIIHLAAAMDRCLMLDDEALVETNFNMGSNEFKLYTNDACAAIAVRDYVK